MSGIDRAQAEAAACDLLAPGGMLMASEPQVPNGDGGDASKG